MISDVINYVQFINILRIHGFDKSYDEEGKHKLFNFFVGKKFTDKDVKAIINGAKKKEILSSDVFVKFQDVKRIIEGIESEYDFNTLKHINDFDQRFKQYYLENRLDYTHLDDVIKDSWKTAVAVSEDVNKSLNNFTSDSIKTMWALACIYHSLSKYLDNMPILMNSQRSFLRVADAIMMTKINNLNANTLKRLNYNYPNINKYQYELFDEFLEALITKTDDISSDEVFSKSDIQDLMMHTSTLVAYASKQKLVEARRALNMYIDSVLDMSKEKPTLRNFSTKNIFLKAGSVMTVSPEKIHNTVNLLLGKNMSEISSSIVSNSDMDASKMNSAEVKIHLLKRLFPNMKINGMSLNKHMYILKSRSTMFINMSTGNLYNATMSIIDCLYKAYDDGKTQDKNWLSKRQKLENLGFDLEKLFHGDNIFDIFPSKFSNAKDNDSEKETNLIDNIKLMSKILSTKDVQKIINHNFNFLTQDVQAMKSATSEIFARAKDYEGLVQAVNEFVNQIIKSKGGSSSSVPKAIKSSRVKLNKDKIKIDDLLIDVDALKELGISIDSKLLSETKMPKTINKQFTVKKDKKVPTHFDVDGEEIDKLIKFVKEHPEVDDDSSLYEETESDKTSIKDENGSYYLLSEVTSEINAINNFVGEFNDASWLDTNVDIRDTILYEIYLNTNRDFCVNLYTRFNNFNKQINELINVGETNSDIRLVLDKMQDNIDTAVARLDGIIESLEKNMKYDKELVAELPAKKEKSKPKSIPTEYDEFVEANYKMLAKLIEEKEKVSGDEKKFIEKIIDKYSALNVDIKPLKVKSYKEAGKKKREDRKMLHEVLEEYQKYVEMNLNIGKLREILASAKIKLNKRSFQKVERVKSAEETARDDEVHSLQEKLAHALQLLERKKAEFNSTYKSKESSRDGHGKRLKGVIEKLEKEIMEIKDKLEDLSNNEHLQ